MSHDSFLLWENNEFIVLTLSNPHVSYNEGVHLIVSSKLKQPTAWEDPELSGRMFKLAARVSKALVESGLAPWVNIQSNGNWGLLPGETGSFHIHLYGRNKTERWGKPILLPELPGTFRNDPMPESDRMLLVWALKQLE